MELTHYFSNNENENISQEELNKVFPVEEVKLSNSEEKQSILTSGESSDILLNINSILLTGIYSIKEVGGDFFTLCVYNNYAIICTFNNNIKVGFRIKLNKETENVALRLPMQLIKQISNRYSVVKISSKKGICEVSLYKHDLNKKPIIMTFPKATPYDGDYMKILDVFKEGNSFGNNTIFTRALPVLRRVYDMTSGFKQRDMLINDGVIYIEDKEGAYKFLADTNIKGFNIVVPAIIMKMIKSKIDKYNFRFETTKSDNSLRVGDFVYSWKNVRLDENQLMAKFKKVKALGICTLNINELVEFISSIKLAKNKEQLCEFDLQNSKVNISDDFENVYHIPIECDGIEISSELPKKISKENLMKPVIGLSLCTELFKSLDTKDLMCMCNDKFFILSYQFIDDEVGKVVLYYILKRKGEMYQNV